MIILVRHAKATGQEPTAELSEVGMEQAQKLASFLSTFFKVDQIISSPFTRALQTINPLSDCIQVAIEIDNLLAERNFCGTSQSYSEHDLEMSFNDFDYRYSDGETNNEALARVNQFISKIKLRNEKTIVVVSHGNMCALILGLFRKFGYADMNRLTNPDVFLLDFAALKEKRLWTDKGVPSITDRHSSRAILFNQERSKIFLFEFHALDFANPKRASKTIWITPGGGIEENEEKLVTLERELFEELGLHNESYHVLGHLWTGEKHLLFRNVPSNFIDHYFLVHLKNEAQFSFVNQTSEESSVLKSHKWWDLKELLTTQELIVPPQLRKLHDFDWSTEISCSFITDDV